MARVPPAQRPTLAPGTTWNNSNSMILNRQRLVRVPVRGLEAFLSRAKKRLRIATDSVSVCLVTNAAIAKWNRAYRAKHGPTDVLSFRFDEPLPRQFNGLTSPNGSRSAYLGDIAIAPAVARRNARRFGRRFDSEMRILVLHGLLHLMGYDHETDDGQMDRRERRLRRELKLA
jgi:probable rRNA maturation factor